MVGGIIGGMLTFMFPPAGAADRRRRGAAIGALTNQGVDGNFVARCRRTWSPEPPASSSSPRVGRPRPSPAALEPFKGTLRQTTLDTDAEEALKRALL